MSSGHAAELHVRPQGHHHWFASHGGIFPAAHFFLLALCLLFSLCCTVKLPIPGTFLAFSASHFSPHGVCISSFVGLPQTLHKPVFFHVGDSGFIVILPVCVVA